MNKPKPKDYGYEAPTPALGEEGGWMIEGGEEAYEAALEKWNKLNASFTPGLWGYTKDEHFMYGENGGAVCLVRGITPEVRNANARLIAAAPDMLKALKAIAGMDPWIADPEMRRLFHQNVYPAIQKATGEQ